MKGFFFSKKLSLCVVIAFIATLSVLGYLYVGLIIVGVICGSGLVSIIAWLLTTYKKPSEPNRILPIYLLTLAALMAHIVEEYVMKFAPRMSAVFHIHFSQTLFTTAFPIAWFIFIGPGIAEFTHFLFPFAVAGPYRYFPGMYTAILPMIPGIWGVCRTIRDYRHRS